VASIGGMAQVVKCLPTKCEALSSNSSTTEEKKQESQQVPRKSSEGSALRRE
jgi:hypothetical protein